MNKGFFASLFDLSFENFVTPKLIKILFIISLAVLAIAYLVIGIGIAGSGGGTTVDLATGNVEESGGNTGGAILWFLLIGPLFLFFYTLFYRVIFELVIVVFRIFENTRDQVSLLREAHPEASDRVQPGSAFEPSTQPPAILPDDGPPQV